ncbi:hypothetical protein GOEFS_095_00480 [Gordonia effusa NBRC 100432]|uniref:GAF domain-containing protein n=1 Tax=Gordonia effusa NBRC 100432 TaxID=1077974 RepID=H0R412_9ACTN|nr:GAF domain-containing protein [Gordonia effusa]GAB19813.1 hypothetical protein GOEFS_095_00480 [Gordonia effusa NBRC 100432]
MGDAASAIRSAYELVRSGGNPTESDVRTIVRESWSRSVLRGVDPSGLRPGGSAMSASEFALYRQAHPMSAARSLVQSLMLDDIADTGVVVALTDEHGRLLWVEGDSSARDDAARIDFVEGAVWSEDVVGTNAPGVALAVDRGVQIVGAEHFTESVQEFNCAAAPVHDPITGHVIGVVDVTGGRAAAAPFALAAVRSVVAAVERELRSPSVDLADPRVFATSVARLTVLTGDQYRWTRPDGSATQLSRRHAEILTLLQAHPEGMNTEQMAMALAEDGVDSVTVRAEISRLRRDLGADIIASRPYRLGVDVESDWHSLRARARTGEGLASAITALGRGGLLADSLAPGIVDLFEELREDIRSRAIADQDVAALTRWTESVHGREDLEAWQALARRLGADHPDRALVTGRIRVLDRRLSR